MDLLAGAIIQGLVSGCVIALLAAGVTIVYRSTRVLNFAQGSLATLGAYAYYQLVVGWSVAPLIAIPLVLLFAAGAGIAAEQVALAPVRRAEPAARSAATIGLVLIVQWIVIATWGADQRFIPRLSGSGFWIGSTRLGAQHLAIVAATVVVGVGGLLLTRTRVGLALAAGAQNAQALELLGVSPRFLARVTMALGSVVGALAGILVTPLLVLIPSQMTLVFVVSLGAALAGGFESLPRTIGAGLALGVFQAIVTSYAPAASGLPQIAGFIAVLGVLAMARRHVDLASVLRGAA